MSYNFDSHIYDTKEIHIGKINLHQFGTNNLYVLDNINESNYNEIIKYILVNKFNVSDVNNIKFKIGLKIILFQDLKYEDFKYSEHGYVFYFFL
jgi:hypothetical protein